MTMPRPSWGRNDPQLSKGINLLILSIFSIALIILVIGVPGRAMNREYRRLAEIHAHGLRAEAQIISIYEQKRYNRQTISCDEMAQYQIAAKSGAIIATNSVSLGECSDNNPYETYAYAHHTIPIAYSSSDPAQAELNFNDGIFRSDAETILRERMGVSAGTLLMEIAIISTLIMVLIWVKRRQPAAKAA